ncbi:MAG: phosphatase [Bacteroidetes bacterium]|nr:MAG: phosphatase [Bacteroidota bacterium]
MNLLIPSFFATIIFFNMTGKNISGGFYSSDQDQKPLFSFGIIADVQYSDFDPEGTKFYRASLEKLRKAFATFKEDSSDFVINLGDLIDNDFASYEPVLDILSASGLKTYNVKGNHDYSVGTRYKKRIPVLTSSKEGYYSFVFKDFRFIFLNGNELSTYVSNNKLAIKKANDFISDLKNKGEINAIDWNGGISAKQLNWLSEQLSQANTKAEKVFIICHFPVFPENVHNLLNYKEVLQILEKYQNIIAWFNGHNHAGNYGNFNQIHFVTFKGMVETKAINSFAIVEVYKNKIWIKGHGREKSQILAY